MKVTVRVDGLKDLEKQLERLSRASAKGVARRAAVKAMKPMAAIAKSLAPRDTGELAMSIEVSAKATGAGARVGKAEFAAVMRGGGSKADAVAAMRAARAESPSLSAAPDIELFMGPTQGATKREAIKRIAQEFGTYKMAAHPYMRPAWDQDKGAMLERLKQNLWDEVQKAISRADKRAARAAAKVG